MREHAGMNEMGGTKRKFRVARIIGMVVAGLIFATIVALVFGILVQALWNWLMPTLFGLATITYWQAFGITLLAKILFSAPPPHRKPFQNHMRKKFARSCESESDMPPHGLSPEKLKDYHDFWFKEGKQAFENYLRKTKSQGINEPPSK